MRFRERFHEFVRNLQDEICARLEAADGRARFRTDHWNRPGGGGGITRVISEGDLIEKGGVNVSAVFGMLPETLGNALQVSGRSFYATGISIVLHPLNPYVPTVHANWRYFELYDDAEREVDAWFGGGSDLTPYYLFEEDVRHFHRTLREAMRPFGEDKYPAYKAQCDQYFVNRHRGNEARGVGGVFYDYLRPEDETDRERLFRFQQANGAAFLPAWLPIAERRRDIPFGERERNWQEIRRGRYVEFNLIHDRGTLFGLRTQGRTESILMSLPPRARWAYDHQPEPGSPEAALLEALKPMDWIRE